MHLLRCIPGRMVLLLGFAMWMGAPRVQAQSRSLLHSPALLAEAAGLSLEPSRAPLLFTKADREYRNLRRTGFALAFGTGLSAGVGIWHASLGPNYCYDKPDLDTSIRRAKIVVGSLGAAVSVSALVGVLIQRARHPGLRVGLGARVAQFGVGSLAAALTTAGFMTTTPCMSS